MDTKTTFDKDLLTRLRRRLKALGVDAFLVPHADRHQSEYLPPSDERLARLTGFDGSAGFAVVTADTAALFVDGRYTLQAAQQVDERAFTIEPIAKVRPSAWLAEHMKADQIIGFDPWLHTPAEIEGYVKAVRQIGARLQALDANPIDAEWAERPQPPASAIQALRPPFAPLTAKAKREMVAKELAKGGAGALVMTTGDALAWAFNIRAADVPFTPLVLGFAILSADGKAELFVDPARVDDQVLAHLGRDVELTAPERLDDALDRLGREGKAVRVDPKTVPMRIVERLEALGARVLEGDDPCQLLKACKTPAEIDAIRRAHVRDGLALVRFLAWLSDAAPQGSVTEMSAAAKIDGLRAEGEHFQGLSFPTISAAGPNGAIVHYRVSEASDRALKKGELYLVDSGAQYLDATTDVTRTVAVGKPTKAMKDRFTRVLKGHIAIARQAFPQGTTGTDLDVLARRALWEAGLDYDHGTGHGVGTYLGVHEGPQRIAKRGPSAELKAGMVLSNEPGYYKAGAFGIRIENLIAVVPMATPRGGERDMLQFDTLTLAPIDVNLVEPDLLDGDETAWLDAYHERVRETLAPHLGGPERAWLENATRPLGGRT